MKLIAFDAFNAIIILEDGVAHIHSKTANGGPRILSENLISRLPDLGFKIVDQIISSTEEAWKIVEEENRKNHRATS